ncbi:MAG TPA: glycosyltransferase [Flavobacteriales bacterium]|nr:glycosyltransferase [Flavobacteriales bacterium]
MSTPPSISVLLPFRNAEATIDTAIASIVQQSLTDFELLLIDNGSRDGSGTIVREWSRRDSRLRVIDEPNIGIAHALNTGLAAAGGRYIARMDADDTAHPDRIERQVSFMEAHPEIGVLGTRTRFETTVEKSSGMAWFVAWQNTILSPHDHYVKRFVDTPLAHPTVLFRKELVSRHGGYDSSPLPEDHELWLRWMHRGVRFAKLQEPLLTWNDHPHRLSRTHPNYSVDAFFTTKAKWIAQWIDRKYGTTRPVIVAGTSKLCQERARLLTAEGVKIHAFTDVKRREVHGYAFIAHDEVPGPGEVLVISFISQRGTGDRIAAFLTDRGLIEGEDFILAA